MASAGRADSAARPALEELSARYWPPLYAFARRRGLDPDAALDATQAFFVELLEGPTLARADASKGRFRSYVRTCFDRFLASDHARGETRRRGGGHRILTLSSSEAERLGEVVPAHELSAEKIFERRWAVAVLDAVTERLRSEYVARGRGERFDALRPHLEGDPGAPSHREAAAALGLTEGAVKVSVHRLRRRFAELLIEEVGDTVGEGEDPVAEIRDLFVALSHPDLPEDV